ncbi:MAG TPA: hypothetical protein VF069_24630 [Streptosporangiaceae bacterium]
MRFLTLLKTAENPSLGAPPMELMGELARLGEEAAKAGVLVDTGGLMPQTAHVKLAGGEISTGNGAGATPIASYAVYDVKDEKEVTEWASRFLGAHQQLWPGWEGEVEIRRVFGPEDFGPPQ